MTTTLRSELSITDAATACGVSRDTIKRRLRSGQFPNAVRLDDGWVIPVGELLDAGFAPDIEQLPTGSPTLSSRSWQARRERATQLTDALERVRELERQIADMRVELAKADGRAQAAEERAAAIGSHLMTVTSLLEQSGMALTKDSDR